MILPIRSEAPLHRRPYVTYTLILIMFIVQFVVSTLYRDTVSLLVFYSIYGSVPAELFGKGASFTEYLSLSTYMFVHAGWLHLIGNVIFLYVFGCKIEDRLGWFRYVIFCLLVGSIAGLLFALSQKSMDIPMVGASSMVSGLMGAYLLKFPHVRIRSYFFVLVRVWLLRIPAYLLLVYWFLLDVFRAWQFAGKFGGVAWLGHIFGFVLGFVLMGLFAGFKVESSASEQTQHSRRELARSVLGMLKGEAVVLVVVLICAPVVMLSLALGWTYVVGRPQIWWGSYGSFRSHWLHARFLLLNNWPVFLLIFALMVGSVYLVFRQRRMRLVMDEEHCLLCDSKEVKGDEDGFSHCHACGFHTRIREYPAHEGAVDFLQEIRISEGFLKDMDGRLSEAISKSALQALDGEYVEELWSSFEESSSVFQHTVEKNRSFLEELLPSGVENEGEEADAATAGPKAEEDGFIAADLDSLMAMKPRDLTTGFDKEYIEIIRDQLEIVTRGMEFWKYIVSLMREDLLEASNEG